MKADAPSPTGEPVPERTCRYCGETHPEFVDLRESTDGTWFCEPAFVCRDRCAEQLADMTDEVEAWKIAHTGLVDLLEKARSDNAALREMLGKHQWGGGDSDGRGMCPSCGNYESEGHTNYCACAALLQPTPTPSQKPGEPDAAAGTGEGA